MFAMGDASAQDSQHSVASKRDKMVAMTKGERVALRELVAKYASAIENKKSDTGAMNAKKNAWDQVELEFCSVENHSKRSVEQLKTGWKNMKQRAKSEWTAYNKSSKKTGGGPPPKAVSDEAIAIAVIVPNQMKSLENAYDCDCEGEAIPAPISVSEYDDSHQQDDIFANENENDIHTPKKRRVERAARKQKDARSSFVDMEDEEHKIRLQILKLEKETAEILKRKAEEELAAIHMEHGLRVQLLQIQLQAQYQYQFPSNPNAPTQMKQEHVNGNWSSFSTPNVSSRWFIPPPGSPQPTPSPPHLHHDSGYNTYPTPDHKMSDEQSIPFSSQAFYKA